MATMIEKISQLYVNVEHQNRDIGSMLVNIAKELSCGRAAFSRSYALIRMPSFFTSGTDFHIVARGLRKSVAVGRHRIEWSE